MSGGLDLGQHLDAKTVGITEHTDKIILCKIAVGCARLGIRVAVTGMNLSDEIGIVESVAASRTDLYKFGQPRDIETPCVIIAEVKMEMIEAVSCEHIKHPAHLGRSLIVA